MISAILHFNPHAHAGRDYTLTTSKRTHIRFLSHTARLLFALGYDDDKSERRLAVPALLTAGCSPKRDCIDGTETRNVHPPFRFMIFKFRNLLGSWATCTAVRFPLCFQNGLEPLLLLRSRPATRILRMWSVGLFPHRGRLLSGEPVWLALRITSTALLLSVGLVFELHSRSHTADFPLFSKYITASGRPPFRHISCVGTWNPQHPCKGG